MRSKSIFLGTVALALAGAVATPSVAWTHHRHMTHHVAFHRHLASGVHHPSTPAERQQTANLNQQQLMQTQNANGMNAGNTATGTATQQNGLATEQTSYQRTSGSTSGMGTSGTAGGTDTTGTTTGSPGVGEDQQVGSPMKGNMQENPGGAVSPPPPANPSGTPQ